MAMIQNNRNDMSPHIILTYYSDYMSPHIIPIILFNYDHCDYCDYSGLLRLFWIIPIFPVISPHGVQIFAFASQTSFQCVANDMAYFFCMTYQRRWNVM